MNEAFPGVSLWCKFDEDCKKAEAECTSAVEAAANERERVINWPGWQRGARVSRAASARFESKKKAAEDRYDEACRQAESQLTKDLDALEEKERQYRGACAPPPA